MRYKVSVVGAGHVGATTAQLLLERELADVVLIDVVEGLPQGKGLDLFETAPLLGYDCHVVGSNNWLDTQGSHIVVITAGLARKPGMSRADLVQKNAAIVRDSVEQVARFSPDAILIMVTNPLDAMTELAYRVSRFPKPRVVGMAGILDAARFRSFIASELGVSVESVHAFVLGGHGDEMVPIARYATVAGVPISELLTREKLARLIERTRHGGAEIVALLKTGSAYYAPAAAVVEMVDAMLKDRKKVLPCCARLEGEYGMDGVFAGVPVVLGARGVERIFEVPLTEDERSAFEASVASVRQLVATIG